MPFSSKAQEIHDHILSSGKSDYWIGAAKYLINRKGQSQPGKPTPETFLALREQLIAELSGAQ
jgi:hypothetical protein